MLLRKKKNRPKWKSCEFCRNVQSSSGGPFCSCNGCNVASPFGWKKWDDCTYFDYGKTCETCDRYETCPIINEARIADKKVKRIRGTCDLYIPNIEMDLYIQKNMEKKPNQKEIWKE